MSVEKDRVECSDDSDDEDYVLGGEDNVPSEEESDGEPEDDLLADVVSKSDKRKTHQKKGGNKRLKLGLGENHHRTAVEAVNLDEYQEVSQNHTKLSEEDEKKRTDSLWSDFLRDTGSSVNTRQASNGTSSKEKDTKTKSEIVDKKENKVTITEVFEFAGEEVKVTKEVPANSLEAQIAACQAQPTAAPSRGGLGRGMNILSRGSPRPTGGGISAVLGQLGKKNKIGTLEKSKIDWERFKKSEGLEEDIQVHNRGKDGYLEKQDFLQRADVRQFEIEKEMRKTRRSNR